MQLITVDIAKDVRRAAFTLILIGKVNNKNRSQGDLWAVLVVYFQFENALIKGVL